MDQDTLIEKLGIAQLDDTKRAEIIEEAFFRVGDVVMKDLTDQQQEEYEAIINDNEHVINAWLEENVPDYKDSPIYQTYVEESEEDPEKNNPAKLFASSAWVQVNVPDYEERLMRVVDEFAQELKANGTVNGS